jgi:hypothetical protein
VRGEQFHHRLSVFGNNSSKCARTQIQDPLGDPRSLSILYSIEKALCSCLLVFGCIFVTYILSRIEELQMPTTSE